MQPSFDNVRKVNQAGRDWWIVDGAEYNDDGTPNRDDAGRHIQRRLVFPVDTLEWRAAEYGVDPTDTATLLDIVVAEAFLEDEDYADGYRLHEAPDIDTARRDHLARCAKVKLRHRLSTRSKNHPLQQIRDESPIHPEILAIKAGTVRQGRAEFAHHQAAKRQVQQVDSEHQRLAMWRAHHDQSQGEA